MVPQIFNVKKLFYLFFIKVSYCFLTILNSQDYPKVRGYNVFLSDVFKCISEISDSELSYNHGLQLSIDYPDYGLEQTALKYFIGVKL